MGASTGHGIASSSSSGSAPRPRLSIESAPAALAHMTDPGGLTRCRRCGAVGSGAESCTCRSRDPASRGAADRVAPAPGGDLVGGRYRLLRVLGEGGFGVVHEAEDPVLARRVAVKIVAARSGAAEFEKEARALARLHHPNLVVVHDVVVEGERRALVMELVEGTTLARLLRDGSSGFGVDETIRIAERVAAAVEHAHQRGVLHGDIKPGNILIDGEGSPRLTDFGTARLLDAHGTTTASPALTLAYAAPERLAGERLTAAADVYALGALIFEIVTGQPPFAGSTVAELWVRIESEPPPSLREAREGVPAELDALVTACLAKQPARRPPGARAVRLALERLVARPATGRGTRALPQLLHSSSCAPATTGERRRVVVLEAALRHVDDARDDLDEAEWSALQGEEIARVLQVVERHGGLVDEIADASVTALFGLAAARPDEARHAVACAAELAAAADASSEALPRRVAVALHSAHAISAGRDPQWSLRDEVRRHGAALLEHAPEGEVLLTDDVVRAGREGFATEPAGALPATRGGGPGVALHRLAPERPAPRPAHPMEGRDDELAMALEFLREGLGGRGVLVTIEGPAGIGKSRLLEAVVARLAESEQALAVLRARAVPGGAPARIVSDIVASMERAGLLRAVAHVIPAADLELLRQPEAVSAMTADELRAALTWHGLALLEASCVAAPIVIVIEDAHDMPREAREILARMAEAARGLPVAWLVTHRQSFAAPWSSRPHHRPLVLGALGEDDVASLARALLGGPPGPMLRDVLRRNAEGLALHVLELARSLRDEGRLARSEDGEWELADPELPPSCPVGLQDLLAARLAPLSASAASFLQCGAILGVEFDPDLVSTMLRIDGNDAGVVPAMHEAIEADILEPQGRRRAAARFRHDLLRAVVLDGMTPGRRRTLSGWAASAIEARHGRGDLATDILLAGHLAASDRTEEACPLALSCSERLEAAGDAARALDLAQLALGLCERSRKAGGERRRALVAIAAASARLGDPGAIDAARRAVEAADPSQDPALAARARLALGRALGRARDPQAALVALEEAKALAERAGARDLALTCLAEQLGPAGTLGDEARAAAILAEFETEPSPPEELLITGLRERARQLFHAGEHEAALAVVDAALERLGENRLPSVAVQLRAQRCPILSALGRHAEARQAAEEADSMALRRGMRPTQSYLRSFLAHVMALQGDLEGAEAHARAAMSLSQRLGSAWDLAVAQRTLSEVLNERGRHEESRTAAEAALETARGLDAPALIAAALLARAEAELAGGELSGAESDAGAVLEILDRHPHAERRERAEKTLRLARSR